MCSGGEGSHDFPFLPAAEFAFELENVPYCQNAEVHEQFGRRENQATYGLFPIQE
jgi:hypothetical protein